MTFSIGSDPEFPLQSGDEFVSAIGRVPSKWEPAELPSGGTIYSDNLNVELTIVPARTRREWIRNLSVTLSEAAGRLGALRLVAQATCEYPAEAFESDEAYAVGCRPEFSVYTNRGRVKRIAPAHFAKKSRVRSCGGHIHIGADICQQDPIRVVKNLDFVLGICSVILDSDPTSPLRRSLYGGAGYHRPTPYGLEYRTPGNFWLSSPLLAGVVYDLVEESLFLATQVVDRGDEASIVEAINHHDKDLAYGIWNERVSRVMPRSIYNSVEELSQMPHQEIYTAWEIEQEAKAPAQEAAAYVVAAG